LGSRLVPLYGEREAAVVTDWVMEHLSGWKKIDRLLHRSEPLSPEAVRQLKKYTEELLAHRPVQYVLHESWFYGLKFYVDERVLIPRPETEELVEWVIAEARAADAAGSNVAGSFSPVILDVGTGSGCIAIALKKQLPFADVYGCDISGEALAIARRNAADLQAEIHFLQLDFRDNRQWDQSPAPRYLVSNPPYIPLKDKATMAAHVVEFEPHLALFVTDNDPLIFYRALVEFAGRKLAPGGAIFAEMNEELGSLVEELFRKAGFQQVIVKKDLQGKDRMIKASQFIGHPD
jgi:release factor glutamine methyltransferase